MGKPVWFAVCGVELIGWLVVLMPHASARTAQSEHTLSFSADGVTAANRHGSQRFEWSPWRAWQRIGDLYLLRGARGTFTFVTQRAFGSADDEGEFRTLLADHLRGPAGSPRAR